MNIIHFSTYDRGGAAQAAYKFHSNLVTSRHKSIFFVMYKASKDNNIIAPKKKIFSDILKIKNRLKISFGIYKKKYSFYNEEFNNTMDYSFYKNQINFKPDAIVLHWVTEFVDLQVIKKLQKTYNIPVFWYLMDMAPMTGGCHYAWDCNGYKTDCKNCPAVTWPYNSFPSKVLQYKQNLIQDMDIKLLAGTTWLKQQLEESTLFQNKPIYDLMLGIDSTIFKPVNQDDQQALRKKFHINESYKIIFFGASKVSDERKGFLYLLKALKILSDDTTFVKNNIAIVTAGHMTDTTLFDNIKIKHYHLGYLNGNTELASAYQLADVFVSSSIEDSGPMMINESMMCGTPVVAFNMGVASDLIINNKTGYIAEIQNSSDLAYGIKLIIEKDPTEYKKISATCRNYALEKTSDEVQLQKFTKIMETL